MDKSESPAKGRSFCQIILSDFSDKIMVPKKFVRKYGKELPVRVYLNAVWPIDLVREDDEVWLQNGWPEFARFHSLCFGHFLVFKYQGKSHFDVFIYSKSSTQADFPIVSITPHMDEQGNLNLQKFTKVRNRATIDTGELKAYKRTRENSAETEACHIGECQLPKLQHQEIVEVASDKDLVGTLKENIQPLDMIRSKKDSSHEDTAPQIEGTSSTRPCKSGGFKMSTKGRLTKPLAIGLPAPAFWEGDNHASSSKNGPKARGKKVAYWEEGNHASSSKNGPKGKKGALYLGSSTNDKEKAKSLALAKVFKYKNPTFMLTVLPSYIDGKTQVDIKSAFAQRYMKSKQNFIVCLQVKGRTWHVQCCSYSNRCRFGKGWPQFADSNSLSVGDVYVFELVNRAQMLLKVFIYRPGEC